MWSRLIQADLHTMRTTGRCVTTAALFEPVRAFVPHPPPPAEPPLALDALAAANQRAETALSSLSAMAALVP